jgi:hypothetical protein
VSRLALVVFFCGLACLAGLLFGLAMASGPLLIPADLLEVPAPLDQLNQGCLGALLLAFVCPFALAPGVVGLAIWWLVLRPRQAALEHLIASSPGREMAFQALLDRLALTASQPGAAPPGRSEEWQLAAAALDARRQVRLRGFCMQAGTVPAFPVAAPCSPLQEPRGIVPARGIRLLALGLGAAGLFCFLWGGLAFFNVAATRLGEMVRGSGRGPAQGLFAFVSCSVPAITCAAGSLGLLAVLRRQQRRRLRHEAYREQTGEVVVAGCLGRIAALAAGVTGSAPDSPVRRGLRASVIEALEELDGGRKGRLLVGLLHCVGSERIDLRGADLRGARLAEAELSDAWLPGADLSGAVLTRARLDRAGLQEIRLQNADLREASAAGADLRAALLRGALLHRCDLSGADLRGCDLTAANCHAVNLAGADLRRAIVTSAQLCAASSVAGARLGAEASEPRQSIAAQTGWRR